MGWISLENTAVFLLWSLSPHGGKTLHPNSNFICHKTYRVKFKRVQQMHGRRYVKGKTLIQLILHVRMYKFQYNAPFSDCDLYIIYIRGNWKGKENAQQECVRTEIALCSIFVQWNEQKRKRRHLNLKPSKQKFNILGTMLICSLKRFIIGLLD